MAQVRRAQAQWHGDLFGGQGTVKAATSGAVPGLPVTWHARAEAADTGMTSPEELLAAAHASCFAMACSNQLAKAGHPAERLDVTVDVHADKTAAGWTVMTSRITVRGKVPGATAESFLAAAEGAKDGCPISRAIAGNVAIELDAALEA